MLSGIKRLTSLILVAIVFVCAAPVVLAATFYAYILVTETAGTTYQMLPIVHSVNVTYMADNGYITENGTDVTISIGGTTYPRMLATENISWATAISGNSSNTFQINTGQTPSDFELTFGQGGYFTVTDAPALEPSDNFSDTYSGWLDTTATTETIVYKQDAFALGIGTASGNVTSNITASDTLPTGFSDPGVTWLNEANAYDNNIGTRATTTIGAAAWSDFLYLLHSNIPTNAIRSYLWKPTADITKVDIDAYYGNAWHNVYEGAYTDATWRVDSLVGERAVGIIRYRFYNNGVPGNAAGIYEGHYRDSAEVSTSGVSSGEKTVVMALESPFLSLGIDAANSPIVPTGYGLALNDSLWQENSSTANFCSIDANRFNHIVTTTTWTPNGYSFDSTNPDRIQIGAVGDLTGTVNMTIMAWVYPTSLAAENRTIISKNNRAGEDRYNLYIQTDGTPIFFYESYNVIHSASGSAGDITVNNWYCIIAQYGSGGVQMSVNNVPSANSNANTNAMRSEDGTAKPTYLGRDYNNDFEYDGLMGHIIIYDNYLTTAEKTQLYNATKSKYTTGDIYTVSTIVSVPDTANDFVYMGVACPYAQYITEEIEGVQVAYYQPNDIIEGTVLPDRAGGDNPGAIVWGANPAGLNLTAYPLILDTTGTAAEGLHTPEALGRVEQVAEIHLSNVALGSPAHELYPIVRDIATLSNVPAYMIWMWISAVFAIGALAVVRKYVNSIFAAGLAACVLMSAFAAMGSADGYGAGVEWWMPASVLLATIASAGMQRTPTV